MVEHWSLQSWFDWSYRLSNFEPRHRNIYILFWLPTFMRYFVFSSYLWFHFLSLPKVMKNCLYYSTYITICIKLLCISEINPQVGCYTPIPNLNVKSFNSNCLSQLTGAPENAAWMVTFSPPLSVYRIAENYFFLWWFIRTLSILKLYTSRYGRAEGLALFEKTGVYLGSERYTLDHVPIDAMRGEIYSACRS